MAFDVSSVAMFLSFPCDYWLLTNAEGDYDDDKDDDDDNGDAD